MRIIRFLFTSFVLVIIVGGVGVLLLREFLLTQATTQMKNSLKEVAEVSRTTGAYASECRKKGLIQLDTSAIKTIQLRFTSDTEYQIEVICEQFSLDPILVSQSTLPRFVSKVPGYTGMIWGDELSGVEVSSFGKTRSAYIEGSATYIGGANELQGSVGPITSCQGNGFTCCQADIAIGQGQQITNVTDCSNNCFSSCTSRPVVLSLSTQPFYDIRTRQLSLAKNEQFSVGYVVDSAGAESIEVTVDFGDGTVEKSGSATNQITHQYNCAQTQCKYEISISAQDNMGISSADTPVTRITVVVQ